MSESVHRFTHGDIEGAVIRIMEDEIVSTHEFLPDELKLDDPEEAIFSYTCCYLRYRGKHVLIDAGFDPDTAPGALESIDVAPEEIELVLLTHADRDHIAGLLMPDGTFTYPNAQHVIGRELWENLRKPETLDGLDEDRAAFYRRFVNAFDDHMRLCEGETEVVPGVRFLPSPGHRVGHAIYEFDSDSATAGAPLLHTGDTFFHPMFAEQPDWPNMADSLPDQARDSRSAVIERAAASGALVLSSHVEFPGIGRIERSGDTTRWVPVS